MNWFFMIIGILCCILGTAILMYYYELKDNEKGGLTFKLRTGGIGFIIIGISLIIRSF